MRLDEADLAQGTGGAGKVGICGEQDDTEQLCKCEVARAVDGEVLAELPTAGEELSMLDPSEGKIEEIAKSQFCSAWFE